MYKKAEASFWTAEEIDLTSNTKDWVGLTDNECHFVSHVLAFFAVAGCWIAHLLAANIVAVLFCCGDNIRSCGCYAVTKL